MKSWWEHCWHRTIFRNVYVCDIPLRNRYESLFLIDTRPPWGYHPKFLRHEYGKLVMKYGWSTCFFSAWSIFYSWRLFKLDNCRCSQWEITGEISCTTYCRYPKWCPFRTNSMILEKLYSSPLGWLLSWHCSFLVGLILVHGRGRYKRLHHSL